MLGMGLTWASFIGILFVLFQLFGTGIFEYQSQSKLSSKFEAASPSIELIATPIFLPTTTIETTTTTTSSTTSIPAPVTTIASNQTTVVGENIAPVEVAPTTLPAEVTTTTLPIEIAPTTLPPVIDPTMVEQSTAAIKRVIKASEGDVIGRIMAPSIGLDKFIVEGAAATELRSAIGRYRGTAFLGNKGNVALAGHRTTYGAPFGRIGELLPGDKINILTPVGTAIYEVMDPVVASKLWAGTVREIGGGYSIVGPSDEFVLADVGDNRLTLTACHPKFSAEERIIVVAQLIGEPFAMLNPEFGKSIAQITTPPTLANGEVASETQVDPSLNTTEPLFDPSVNVDVTPVAIQTLSVTLDGLPNQIAPSIVFALMTLIVMTAIAAASEKFGRLRAYMFGSVPCLLVLWFFFRHLELLLPAY
jgi:LPXTG-site transpeptidase (sortase) family protein